MTNLLDLWKFPLRFGNSDDPRNGACLLDAVSWLEYGTLGDHPFCVCPVITAFGRGINDALSDTGRQRLRVFIPRLVGTVDPASERVRAEFLAWQAVRVFAPLALDAVGLIKDAQELREFEGSLRDAANAAHDAANAARNAARNAANAARNTANAAHNAANAANAARNAAHDAYNAANAAHDAYNAANAAHDAYNAANAARNAANAARNAARNAANAVWAAHANVFAAVEDAMIAALDGVLQIGRRAKPIPESRFSAAVRSFELAR